MNDVLINTVIEHTNMMFYNFSINIAEAPPPPLQIAATPIFALFCSNTFSKVTKILDPEFPNG